MSDEDILRSRAIEMLQDTLFFEKNITDKRLSDFQNCFQESVKHIIKKIGFQSREDMLESLKTQPVEDFWSQIKGLHQEIHGLVDSRMNIITELFFKGDEMDQISRVFFQSTFQRVRRIIATSKVENMKIISEILYRLIILSVLCQYREKVFKEAVL
jgi:methyl coenzyme M reductase alpha subunit